MIWTIGSICIPTTEEELHSNREEAQAALFRTRCLKCVACGVHCASCSGTKHDGRLRRAGRAESRVASGEHAYSGVAS